MPMAWPFLTATVGSNTVTQTLQAANQMPTTQQLLLAPRAIPRRRYFDHLIVSER